MCTVHVIVLKIGNSKFDEKKIEDIYHYNKNDVSLLTREKSFLTNMK